MTPAGQNVISLIAGDHAIFFRHLFTARRLRLGAASAIQIALPALLGLICGHLPFGDSRFEPLTNIRFLQGLPRRQSPLFAQLARCNRSLEFGGQLVFLEIMPLLPGIFLAQFAGLHSRFELFANGSDPFAESAFDVVFVAVCQINLVSVHGPSRSKTGKTSDPFPDLGTGEAAVAELSDGWICRAYEGAALAPLVRIVLDHPFPQCQAGALLTHCFC